MTAKPDSTSRRFDFRRAAKRDALAIILATVFVLAAVPAARAGSMEGAKPRSAPPADSILVVKSEHRLYLMRDGLPLRSFSIALGLSPVGPKRQEYDFRTPEGRYVIDARRTNSRYFRALHVSYPNTDDRRQAAERHVSAGRDIMIHGLPNVRQKPLSYYQTQDWTNGCIALSNEDLMEVWALVHDRIPVEILP
jgi:murein L,D-transpeptidase YafK